VGTATSQGFTKVLGHKFYFKTFGKPRKGTILCLHGGPGSTHNYMLPLTDLARFGYKLVFYDQLGCGKSEMPKNPGLFTVERAVEDTEAFRKALNLGKVILIGSSWGGMLAIAYALKYQEKVKSMITVGGLASVPLTIAEMDRLRSRLPPKVVRVMKKYEALGQYENPEYLKAVQVFYDRYLCRLKPWPQELMYTIRHMSKPVYGAMNGPNEFTIIGNIRHWDVTSRLHRIRVPTLVTGSKYDEVSPKVARSIHKGIRGSKLVVFEKSAHLPFWEERDHFMQVVREFLDSVNNSRYP
jgi:proline iminopeptidase